MRILIIEDERRIAGFLAKGLVRQGYEVECAYTGSDGLAQVDEGPGRSHFDLVVLDLGLPDLDGLEVLRILRTRGLDVPVLVFTARNDSDDRNEALRLGAVRYLTKPVPFPDFLGNVRASLESEQGAVP